MPTPIPSRIAFCLWPLVLLTILLPLSTPDADAKAFASGHTTCSILNDGRLKCWGDNGGGELGAGDTENRGDDAGEMGEALAALDFGSGLYATALAGGRYTTSCARLNDGSLRCWGRNTHGQLGIGDVAHRGDNPYEMGDYLPAVVLVGADLPVELTSFTATIRGTDVVLSWATATEINNAGFEVQRQQHDHWQTLGYVTGAGTTTEAQRYRFRTDGSAPGTYRFRLKQTDFDSTSAYSPEVEVLVGASQSYSLRVTGAHPVRNAARLQITVARTQHVGASVYDALGRRVAQLHDGIATPTCRRRSNSSMWVPRQASTWSASPVTVFLRRNASSSSGSDDKHAENIRGRLRSPGPPSLYVSQSPSSYCFPIVNSGATSTTKPSSNCESTVPCSTRRTAVRNPSSPLASTSTVRSPGSTIQYSFTPDCS